MPVTNYIWDVVSDNVLMEKDDDGETIARYVQEPELYGEVISQERGGETRYFNYDGEGNTCELTDENENVTDTYEYSAFGKEIARTGTTVNPFGFKGSLGYYTNGKTNDIYVRTRPYVPSTGRWLSQDRVGFVDGPNHYLYVLNSAIGFVDPSGEFRITADETSCPGCGKAAVYWRFREHTLDEWFVVQRVCTTVTIQECRKNAASCCEPQDPKTCNHCFYERIFMSDTGGHDLWRLPWYIPDGICGTIGFGLSVAELRTFPARVTRDNNDQWEEPGVLKFCDFPYGVSVGSHRDAAPEYWERSTARYASFMLAGWNCCNKDKAIGFMIYGTSGSGIGATTCGDGSNPQRPTEHIPW